MSCPAMMTNLVTPKQRPEKLAAALLQLPAKRTRQATYDWQRLMCRRPCSPCCVPASTASSRCHLHAGRRCSGPCQLDHRPALAPNASTRRSSIGPTAFSDSVCESGGEASSLRRRHRRSILRARGPDRPGQQPFQIFPLPP